MHKSWRFGIAVKSIDRISSSIDRHRSNLCGAGISETLANSINTILFSFVRREAAEETVWVPPVANFALV
jgi:hypothetical protein